MPKKIIVTIIIVTLLTTVFFFDALKLSSHAETGKSKVLKYVAVGDSFTKGEGVQRHQSWPNLVTRMLQQTGIPVELVANPAKSGWTSQQLLDHQLKVVETYEPDLVTVLVGLNDYAFEAVTPETYEANLKKIIENLKLILKNPKGIVLITIPDFASTPYGIAYYKRFGTKDKIPKYNQIIKDIASANDLNVIDLFSLTAKLSKNQYMFADKLHPSPLQHEYWAEFMYPKLYLSARELN